MTCFQHCPDEYPFVIKENRRSICTNSCKKLHFRQECLDKCPHSHSSIHRGECVQCNQIGMYEENHHCVNSCKVVQFEKRCYDTCSSAAKFVYNGSCVRTCPSNANKVDKRRYDKYTVFFALILVLRINIFLGTNVYLVVLILILHYTKTNAYSAAN